MSKSIVLLSLLAALSFGGEARAQAPPPAAPSTAPPPPYGAPIGVTDAKKAAAAAIAEVAKVGSAPDAIAVVDHGGVLIYFERVGKNHPRSLQIATPTDRSAAPF